ncbi:GAF domain-containing protein [Nocardia sp. GCM10030253]|uniref:GAF domain-containing protein n=1 Tax=Nocardia sp. GCM10030253 TaxID=3273404 RepID=UPI00362BF4EE
MAQFLTDPVTDQRPGLDSGCALVGQLIALAVAQVPGRPAAGITAYRRGDLTVVAASTPRAQLLDRIQLICGNGPGVEALATARPLTAADLTVEHRWPDCVAWLTVLGVRSLHCQPLVGRGHTALGVLTFYSAYPTTFGGHTERIIATVAFRAATVLGRDTATTTREPGSISDATMAPRAKHTPCADEPDR